MSDQVKNTDVGEVSKETSSFSLDATDTELLEEFGVLLAAEYNYMAAT